MSDRSWNAIDARIYDEDWSTLAILICQQIIVKCPNQYGVYKLPTGFLKRFFNGMLADGQPTVDQAIQELVDDGVVRLFGETVWIVNKWGRDKYSGIGTNQVGAVRYLAEHYPDVVPDFCTKYGLSTLLGGTSESESDSEPDTDTEPEKKKTLPSKSDGGNSKPKKAYVPIEDRKAKTPVSKLVKYWHVRYRDIHGIGYTGDMRAMSGQAANLVKRNKADLLAAGINCLLTSEEHAKFRPHTWDHFVKNASTYILEAKEAGYEPGFYID